MGLLKCKQLKKGKLPMYYSGIDYHKRYSVVCIINKKGEVVLEKRIDPRNAEEFKKIHLGLPETCRVVFEASTN